MASFIPAVTAAARNQVTPEMIAKYAQSNPQLAQMLQTRYNSTQFLNQQSPEDQANIRASWTGTPQVGRNSQQDQWYNAAVQAGSAPANTRPAVQPPAQPQPAQPAPQMPANAQPAPGVPVNAPWGGHFASGINNLLTSNFGAPAQKPAPAPAAPAQPAPAAKMSYDDAKAKYGRERAMAGQASGEFGS